MNRDRVIQITALFVLAISLFASGVLSMTLSNSAGRSKLAYTVSQETGDPPQVALGIAMGAFRGLFVNFLWIRANTLKEEGKYHEAMDLAKAVTTLQPRFPDVWVFHAWNMAYNISVTTHTMDERWAWVNRGIDLLRRQGVVHNPTDMAIHKELGWIFLHKISGFMDDANPVYKRRLAEEWTLVLGEPPRYVARETREEAIARFVEWLRPIDEAPGSMERLLDSDPAVLALVDAYTRTVSPVIDRSLLERFARHTALRQSGRRDFLVEQFSEANIFGPRALAMEALLENPDYDEAWGSLVAHVRKRVLIDEYNMQPGQMIRFTKKYGPLDWRHAASHAVYWVARGVEGALTRRSLANERDYDFVNTDRITIQAVQDLFRSGQVYFDFVGMVTNPANAKSVYLGFPNPHFVETYEVILDELRARAGVYERIDATNETPGRIYTIYSAGYENFMKDVIRYYYRMGMKQKATQMKDDLGKWEGMNTNDPKRAAYYALDIETFVRMELRERLQTPQVSAAEVNGSLIAAYINGLLLDDEELFSDNLAYAKLVHRHFFNEQARVNTVAMDMARMESQLDVDFEIVEAWTFVNTMAMVNMSDAERMYDNADMHLRVISYDGIADTYRVLYDESDEMEKTFDEAFPEPPGLEAHRIRAASIAEERAARALNREQK